MEKAPTTFKVFCLFGKVRLRWKRLHFLNNRRSLRGSGDGDSAGIKGRRQTLDDDQTPRRKARAQHDLMTQLITSCVLSGVFFPVVRYGFVLVTRKKKKKTELNPFRGAQSGFKSVKMDRSFFLSFSSSTLRCAHGFFPSFSLVRRSRLIGGGGRVTRDAYLMRVVT